jgi:tetratricopeptide (TPR) repeat protein
MSFDALLQAAWRDHGDQPEAVASCLTEALPLIESPTDFGPFVRLLTHVYGEHLGEWQRGLDLLQALTRVPAFDDSTVARGPITRGAAMLRYASGDHSALAGLTDEDATYALATAADALAARGQIAPAIDAFSKAMAHAPATLTTEHPAVRALAVVGNNLSVALEKSPELDLVESQAMIAAAEAGLRYWKIAGTWLEEERAEYQLSLSRLRAGDLDAALESIDRCIEICTRYDAEPFELFFGYAVQAVVYQAKGDLAAFAQSRGAAMAEYANIPDSERAWCNREHNELGG